MADVDSNSNGIDDVWELLYNARDVAASADEDRDRVSNGDEARAGTDPFDPNDFLEFSTFERSGTTVTVTFQSQKGKVYKIYQSGSTINPSWAQVDTDIVGDGAVMEKELTGITETEAYFRIGVDDADADGDNLTDWAEEQLDGFDPGSNFSYDSNTADDETFVFLFENSTGPLEVEITVLEDEAYEKFGDSGDREGTIRVRRTGGNLAETTVFFTVGGDAQPADFSIVDEEDNPVNGFITIGAGQPQRVLSVVPADDGVAEFPQTVQVTLDPHPDYGSGASTEASVRIFDLEDNAGNWQLFYGQLTPERGATTSASGYATLRLNGKRTRALVDLNFSGLSSTQIAAHVHQSTPNGSGGYTNGPVMESLELGIVDDHVWDIGPAGANSAQDLIDALFGQNGKEPLYANAHTTNNGGGEVWAFLSPYSSGDFNPPPDPPAIDPLEDLDLKRDISRFLTQATFGPTLAELDALYDSVVNDHSGDRIAAYSQWIDDQYAETDTKFYDLLYALDTQEFDLNGNDPVNTSNPQPFNNHHRISWWTIARGAKDQLRKRVAFALGQILVISEENATVRGRSYGATNYFDMLSENADDSYREVLLDVSKHPMMGKYLSHLQNDKATYDNEGNILISPDENYAREIMQLFSIGLVFLNPDGSLLLNENGEPIQTYTNGDITELARVFTGWSFSRRVGSRGDGFPESDNTYYYYYGGPRYFEGSWMNPMKNFGNNYHDNGAKAVLGTDIPAGLSGEQDLQAAVDILFNHQNTGPFIARRLIQRLVCGNPSSGYIYRVGQAFENSNGNIKETVRAILLDYEARDLSLVDDIGFGKQKEPVIRQASLMRALESASSLPVSDLSTYGLSAGQIAGYEPGATQHRFYDMTSRLAQSPHHAPSVFNWFLPDYLLGGALSENGLVAPEFAITSETQVVESANLFWTTIASTTGLFGRPIYGQPSNTGDHRMYIDLAGVQQQLTDAVAVAPGANNSEKERNAIEVVLDKYDLLLCSGSLKVRYGNDSNPNPRNAIIEACELVWNHTNDDPGATDLREVARNILYLLTSSPDFLIQQ